MERLTGWKRRVWTHAAFGVLTVITGGLVWIVVYLFPQTMLWLLQECSLEEAQYVLAKVH